MGQKRKIYQCSECGDYGHNKRKCPKYSKSEEETTPQKNKNCVKKSNILTIECPLCLDYIKDNSEKKVLKCHHIFHCKCISLTDNFCPFCKKITNF